MLRMKVTAAGLQSEAPGNLKATPTVWHATSSGNVPEQQAMIFKGRICLRPALLASMGEMMGRCQYSMSG